MREVNQVFQKGFAVGLRPYPQYDEGGDYLTECLNMVPTKMGLVPRPEIVDPLGDLSSFGWPFPALYVCQRYCLVFTNTAVYRVDGNWNLTPIVGFSWGGLPHIADFMDFLVIASPNGTLSYDGKTVKWLDDGVTFKTCTNFRGQLIGGDGNLKRGPEAVPGGIIDGIVDVEGESLVGWAKIGALSWDYSLGNEVGWAPMPWMGRVLALLTLGREIVVYGQNGVVKMAPSKEPVATFGVADFGDIGCLSRDCVAGDGSMHLFLGSDYDLYAVIPEKPLSGEGKNPIKLGYREHLADLEDPIVTFDPIHRYWWIGDRHKAYIYSGEGLGESGVTPTHLGAYNGELVGLVYPHRSDMARVTTGNLCFDSRGVKTLMCVETDMEANAGIVSWTNFRYKTKGQYKKSKEVRNDPRGAFFPIVSGTDIRVTWEAEDFRSFFIRKAWLHFKNTDKTFSRGVINAGRPAEQAGG